jgi:tetratricopeptide (TPR) repeat protein
LASTSVTVGAAPTLGDRVRAARREKGLSQAQLAGDELTKGFISQVESGLVRPSVRSLQIIAARLGKSLDHLIGDQALSSAKRVTFHLLAAQAAAERRDFEAAAREAASALEHEPAVVERAKALRFIATAEMDAGRREAAFERIAEALRVLRPEADPVEYAELLYVRAMNYSALGQLGVATESYEAARDTVEKYEVTAPRLRSRILVALGTMYRRLNRTAKAMTTYEQALALASRSSELDLAARGYMGVAVALYDSGELDGAISNYQRALELFRRVADTSFELNVLQSLAAVRFEQGDIEGARSFARTAMERGESVGDTHWAAVAEVVLARIAIAEGDPLRGLLAAQHAEAVLGEAHDEIQRADALRVQAAAADALGRFDEADEKYRASIAVYGRIGDRADLSTIAAEYAQRLRARGNVDEAFEMLELARDRPPRR